ncbi:hypothetical protein [Neptuniibacter sp. QD37_11]|uniref:hypothetical protein n=1 Tax=Neptuniibacter sp. QD37_11 TaxID=3398209 RepID=UPI0039F53080
MISQAIKGIGIGFKTRHTTFLQFTALMLATPVLVLVSAMMVLKTQLVETVTTAITIPLFWVICTFMFGFWIVKALRVYEQYEGRKAGSKWLDWILTAIFGGILIYLVMNPPITA